MPFSKLMAFLLTWIIVMSAVGEVKENLKLHVEYLAGQIGERNFLHPGSLEKSAGYIRAEWEKMGYSVEEETYCLESPPLLATLTTSLGKRTLEFYLNGKDFKNVIATKSGSGQNFVVVGAHYDSVVGSPGADDNASGTAVLIEVARQLKNMSINDTVELVAFVNEEPPFFRTSAMGSYIFVQNAWKNHKKIRWMLCIEMVGCFSDTPHSQKYPPIFRYFYPHQANFIASVGNLPSWRYVRRVAKIFRGVTKVPTEYVYAPAFIPGIDLSDQLNFWAKGIPAVMITDTAFYRNSRYHTEADVPDTLDYDKMAEVVQGIVAAVTAIK